MTQIQINLTDAMKLWLDEQVAQGRFRNIDDAIAQLVQNEQKLAEQKKLEGMLEEGLSDANPTEWRSEDFTQLKERIAGRRTRDVN